MCGIVHARTCACQSSEASLVSTSRARGLTPQQRAVFAAVVHYHEALGEAVPAAYVARRLAITRQRVGEYFITLKELGWLRSAGSPAIPARPLPPHATP